MTGFEIAAATALASAAVGGTTTMMAARARNKELRASQEANARSLQVRARQLRTSEGIKRKQAYDEAKLMEQKLRVASGEAIGLGGATLGRSSQAFYDAEKSAAIGRLELAGALNLSQSQANATHQQLSSNMVDPFSASIVAAVQGASQGLQMYNNVAGMFPPDSATPVTRMKGISSPKSIGSK